MIDITHKNSTKRTAIASATIKVGSIATIDAVINKQVPKGDVLEMAKTAGLFAVKNTSNSIPDCHPLPIEFTQITYELNRDACEIKVLLTVATIYKTGVEVEAMHGAAIVALTIYDMLKPIDKNIEIQSIKLEHKKGGKSDYKANENLSIKAAVIVCSDSIFAKKKTDAAGLAIIEKLKLHAIEIEAYDIISDDSAGIADAFYKYVNLGVDLILFTGGTGISSRDNTPETIRPLLDKELPGVAEHMRKYGMERIPYAMLSRSVVGIKNRSLVATLPGSTNGAKESMDAIFPAILHSFQVFKNEPHKPS